MSFNLNPILSAGKPRVEFQLSQNILDKWQSSVRAETTDGDVIEIYDVIGFDYWSGGGITAKRISEQLKGKSDVTVNINSPGGDLFEGLAIYNLLAQHPGKVTTNIVGIAASAASIIAMAGDERHIGKAAFFMIHNCWGVVVGNRLDFAAAAETMNKFDLAMAGVYEDAIGGDMSEIIDMMNAETWLGAEESIEHGFATHITERGTTTAKAASQQPLIKALDRLLAKEGIPRSQRRSLFNQIKTGTQNATPDTQNAVTQKALAELQNAANQFSKIAKGN